MHAEHDARIELVLEHEVLVRPADDLDSDLHRAITFQRSAGTTERMTRFSVTSSALSAIACKGAVRCAIGGRRPRRHGSGRMGLRVVAGRFRVPIGALFPMVI